jgi:hypothetical protein
MGERIRAGSERNLARVEEDGAEGGDAGVLGIGGEEGKN